MNTFTEAFEEQVKTCMANLYDPVVLHNQSLLHDLMPNVPQSERTQAFRKLVMELIESLRSDHDTNAASRQYRRFLILQRRYIEEQQHAEIMPQVSLSERQYYREHREALRAITQLLWNRRGAEGHFSVQTEARRIYKDSNADTVDLAEVFTRVAKATEPLAAWQGGAVHLPTEFPRVPLRTHRDILHQLIIWLVSRLLDDANGEAVHISCEQVTNQVIISFRPASDKISETANTFLKLLSARIHREGDTLQLKLPYGSQIVLLVDDNPDTLILFRRLLVNTPYEVAYAQDQLTGIKQARETACVAVLLDVMMPEHDGWEMLQKLKNHPGTAHIPVIICSVLEVEDLALAMGADAYLHKPPSRDDLIRVLADRESVTL